VQVPPVLPGRIQELRLPGLDRGYKWTAHERWMETLGREQFWELLDRNNYAGIAQRSVSIAARTNLLFSFEGLGAWQPTRSFRCSCRDRLTQHSGGTAIAVATRCGISAASCGLTRASVTPVLPCSVRPSYLG
jgi:hypothetical protein